MATAFAPPEGYDFEFKIDVFNCNFSEMEKAEEDYIKRLRKFCKDNTDSNNPLVGEIVKTGRGDGYAVYMIFRTKPLQLIHVPIGDAWHADPVWIRGLRLSDAKKMVEADKALAKMFSKKN